MAHRAGDQLVDDIGHDRIEAGGRLVEEQDLGLRGDGAREPDALAHAARQLGRPQVGDIGAEPDLRECGDRAFLRLGAPELLDVEQPERDVLPDRQAVEQSGTLEQHPELLHHLLAGAAAEPDHLLAVDYDRAPIGLEQAEHAFQQHRFAGARAADHDDQLALGDVQFDAVQDLLGAKALVQVADADLDRGLAHRLKNSSVTK